MKRNNYYLYLENDEYDMLIKSLIKLKHKMLEEGKYGDCVDELLVKLAKARKKTFKIKYV